MPLLRRRMQRGARIRAPNESQKEMVQYVNAALEVLYAKSKCDIVVLIYIAALLSIRKDGAKLLMLEEEAQMWMWKRVESKLWSGW
jgi:hypothetical protein